MEWIPKELGFAKVAREREKKKGAGRETRDLHSTVMTSVLGDGYIGIHIRSKMWLWGVVARGTFCLL